MQNGWSTARSLACEARVGARALGSTLRSWRYGACEIKFWRRSHQKRAEAARPSPHSPRSFDARLSAPPPKLYFLCAYNTASYAGYLGSYRVPPSFPCIDCVMDHDKEIRRIPPTMQTGRGQQKRAHWTNFSPISRAWSARQINFKEIAATEMIMETSGLLL